jgi:cytochrome P450
MNVPPSIPLAPGALPVLGHIGPLLRDPWAFLNGLPAHGQLVRIRVGPTTAVMVCDPELTREVMLDDRTFDKGGPFYDRARESLSNGLATCPHHDHRRQRRLVQPAFHRARLPGYARVMAAQIAARTRDWHDGQILDVLAETDDFAMKTLAATMFSDRLPPAELRQIARDVATVDKRTFWRMVSPVFGLPTPGNLRYRGALTRIREVTDRLVAEGRASGTDSGDLLSAMLAAHDPEDAGRGLSDSEIHDQVMTFIVAGVGTMGATVAWALYLVGTHPDIEERLHAEIDAVLGGQPVSYDDLPRLELTGRIITETLRVYSPAWLLTRAATCDTRLADHAIPAGTVIAMSPYLLHRRGDLFDRPDEFDPDRWLPERAAAVPRGAYVPFVVGARQCIGNQFGSAQAILALAIIAARWRLQPLPGQRVRPSLAGSVRPRGLRMRAVARGEPAPQ